MTTYLLLLRQIGAHGFDTIAAFDDVGLERYWARAAMELEEEAACVAEHRARLVAAPERRRRGPTVLALRLLGFAIVVSYGRHDDGSATLVEAKWLRNNSAGEIRWRR